MPEDIYPEFARMLNREAKERLLRQQGLVVWLYGLSGSGKSTLANALERRLHEEGFLTQILDGDNIRSGLNSDLGFSDADRDENIRRIAEVAKLFLNNGTVTLTSFITPHRAFRQRAREIVGAERFVEVYVEASFETCAERDVKGLYKKAAGGGVANFTGKDSSFEPPEPDDGALIINTEQAPLDKCVNTLYNTLLPKIRAV